ncbi:MAG: cobalamin-binding domain-containing protein [Nitrospirota bacterium]
MKILLVEPSYQNKYPPLGLMKLAKFHKLRGDDVSFVKGLDKDKRAEKWDRIYITTLFSFYWNITIKTINYYEFSAKDPKNIFIGGPMATIMAEEIEQKTGFTVIKGLLNEKDKINLPGEENIDSIVPDYSILNDISYKYPSSDAYFTYTTRGCVRKCEFCAVSTIEPQYIDYIPLKKQIHSINEEYGERKDLLLLDNNVLASGRFEQIIDEIKDIGFVKGAKLRNRHRYVDFNQGTDHRLLTKQKLKKLSEIPIRPLRIAFDMVHYKDAYIKCIEWAAEYGLLNLSNYILYNYDDKPDEFYERLRINVELNERLGTKTFSFPMKYVPTTAKDRKYVGKYWNRKYLRSIHCILNATHGIVGPKLDFFEAAFGKDIREYRQILLLPEDYIIDRHKHSKNGASDWNNLFTSLSEKYQNEFIDIITENSFKKKSNSHIPAIMDLLKHYY